MVCGEVEFFDSNHDNSHHFLIGNSKVYHSEDKIILILIRIVMFLENLNFLQEEKG